MDKQNVLMKEKLYLAKHAYMICHYHTKEKLYTLLDKVIAHVREKTPAFRDADEFLKSGLISLSQYHEDKIIREFETELTNIRKYENEQLLKASKEGESHDR